VADLSPQQLQRLARHGARAVLEELERSGAHPWAFPTCSESGAVRRKRAPKQPRQRPAGGAVCLRQRKAVSERMKKYWADRRKAKAKK
jgi:hypothetical protein